jgi:hypothetical protein
MDEMELPVKLFKNKDRPYSFLATEDKKDVIWAKLIDDERKEAGNRITYMIIINSL